MGFYFRNSTIEDDERGVAANFVGYQLTFFARLGILATESIEHNAKA